MRFPKEKGLALSQNCRSALFIAQLLKHYDTFQESGRKRFFRSNRLVNSTSCRTLADLQIAICITLREPQHMCSCFPEIGLLIALCLPGLGLYRTLLIIETVNMKMLAITTLSYILGGNVWISYPFFVIYHYKRHHRFCISYRVKNLGQDHASHF